MRASFLRLASEEFTFFLLFNASFQERCGTLDSALLLRTVHCLNVNKEEILQFKCVSVRQVKDSFFLLIQQDYITPILIMVGCVI